MASCRWFVEGKLQNKDTNCHFESFLTSVFLLVVFSSSEC